MGDGVERLHEVDCRGPHFDSTLVAFLVNHSVRRKMICCLVRASESHPDLPHVFGRVLENLLYKIIVNSLYNAGNEQIGR